MKKLLPLLVALPLLLSACGALMGDEIARIPLSQPCTTDQDFSRSDEVALEVGETIKFWTDIKMKHSSGLQLMYFVDIVKDGDYYGTLELDPLDVNTKLNSVETSNGKNSSTKYKGKMESMEITEAGNYAFQTCLYANNASLEMEMADLVVTK